MAISRIVRVTEKRERQRIRYSIIGIVGLITFVALFGLKILVGFSLLLDKVRGGSPVTTTTSILIPPVLNPLSETTNTEAVTVTGSGQGRLALVLYFNDTEINKQTLPENGEFSFPITLQKGTNTISAKLIDDKGNASELSNILTITLKTDAPGLDISEPTDGQTIEGENNKISVIGKTEEGNTVTINGRFVIVNSDGSFQSTITLNEGENRLNIVALDTAGNQTVVSRAVHWQP